ncbi:flavin-containing monooxygenase [Cumulibacter soli]|uniref:flavin-containing monooxygenase n=1 Tax=Cumulibacter soli TaxID=2546344 RepID=UPI0010675302|nr:NAD(P)/FAD-dependent oxidoreductase [Cumulibacter soli]
MGNTIERRDAVVVGAGFGGLYSLKRLRDDVGINTVLLEKGSGVGGTWFWNRYPGAMSDTESFVYRYSFDRELLQEAEYKNTYLLQPQVLEYLQQVVERYDLAKDIRLSTEMTAATFDEDAAEWVIETDTGTTYRAKFLITGLGLLSATNWPDITGLDDFAGERYHTGSFPNDVTFEGKRVGVIGTGSTGVQVITAIASKVGHLSVFQRSAQYSVPSGFKPVDEQYLSDVRARYDDIWDQVKSSVVAFGFQESTVPAMSVSAEERQRVFQENWDKGNGFRFMFGTFSDIATDPDANKAAQDFIKGKIAEIVEDPQTAQKLMPTDIYAKRPLCDSGYYQVYNRDNVELIDIKANPIERFTESGIVTADGVQHELDMVILATGFDAVDGNYTRLRIKGKNDVSLRDHWTSGPTSYLGVTVTGFPNMFMILGPNGPFTNLPPSIETQVEFITDTIADLVKTGREQIEPTADAEEQWTSTCREIADMTLFPKAESWIFGANIPGKPNTVMFYMAGLGAYRGVLSDVRERDYEGFALT